MTLGEIGKWGLSEDYSLTRRTACLWRTRQDAVKPQRSEPEGYWLDSIATGVGFQLSPLQAEGKSSFCPQRSQRL